MARRQPVTTTRRRGRLTARDVVSDALIVGSIELSEGLEALRSDTAPDVVHRARIATRRLGSALRLGPELFMPGSVDAVRAELGWFRTALAEVRDIDVMLERLRDIGADEKLIATVYSERSEAVIRLMVVLRDDRTDVLIADLHRLAKCPPTVTQGDDDAARRFRPVLTRRMRKLERAARALGPSPTPKELHRVRILAKRSRYGCEASIEVFGEPMRVVSRRLRDLQDALGELQDGAVLASYLRDLAARNPALAFSAGEAAGLVAARREANHSDWRRAWRRVEPRLYRWR